jgi:hypothetical protein
LRGRRRSGLSRIVADHGEEYYRSGAANKPLRAEIAGNFGRDGDDIERARLWLARVMLSIANEDSPREVAVLKRAALEQTAGLSAAKATVRKGL